LGAAIKEATAWANENGVNEICVLGGERIFTELLPRTDRLYVTHVLAQPEGDTHFPQISEDQWLPVDREQFPAGPNDSEETVFVTYERKTPD